MPDGTAQSKPPVSSQFLNGLVIEITRASNGEAGQAMMDYWYTLLANTDETGPHWSDVDLMAIHKTARFMIVKDVIDGGKEFRNRYWGTGLVRAFNFDATGRLLAEYYDEKHREQLKNLYDLTAAERRTLKIRGQGQFFPNQSTIRYEAAHAPIYDDEGHPSQILVAYDFLDPY